MEIHYKLRITLEHTTFKECVELIKYISPKKYAYVCEEGKINDKAHIHCYIVSIIKEDTMRARLRKLSLSSRGNKLYSLVKLSLEEGDTFACEYLAYMYKEGKVFIEGFTETEVELARAYDNKVKKEIKEKKEKRQSRYKRIMKKFKEYKNDFGHEIDANGVIEWVIQFFKEEETVVSVNTLSQWCNTLMLKYLPEYSNTLSIIISKNIFRDVI